MSKIKVFMGIPSTGIRQDSQLYNLRRIEAKYGDRVEFVYPEQMVRRMFHDFARNQYVEEFLDSDCDILWFLDSDVTPPVDIIDLITEHGDKWSVAGAAYPVIMTMGEKNEPRIVLTAYQTVNGTLAATEVYRSGLEFVDGLATGCMFIRRGVFDLLEKPYFEFKYRKEDMFILEGEDLGFCRKVNELGLKFLTNWGMVCRHHKTVDLLDINNYTIDYANAKLQAYDKMIRKQVEELQENVRGKIRPHQSRSKLILPGYLSE